jgi:hypothetical protein
MQIKITKRQRIYNNRVDLAGENFYYLVNGRIINDDNTKYKKFKFVVWFDSSDLYEAMQDDKGKYNKDYYITPLEYLNELIPTYTDYISSYDNCKDFYNICNDTIIKFNDSICRI